MKSLLDNDLYKFTMAQAVLHHFPSVEVEYRFVCRSSNVDLLILKDKIEAELEELCRTRLTLDELEYLKSIRFLKKDFIFFLEDLTLKRRFVTLFEENGKLALSIKGPWIQTILFEVPLLSIISEVYCATQTTNELAYEVGTKNLLAKIEKLKKYPHPLLFADFGTRRRFSRAFHDEVVSILKVNLPDHFVGTSNLLLAKKYNLKAIGTMAHEWIQAGQGMNLVQLAHSQKQMLEIWSQEYRGDLGIALTDTINLNSFLNDFDRYLAKLYDGCRHDSGDPIAWGEALIAHYLKLGIDPKSKSAVFSDNLNMNKAMIIEKHFRNRIKVSFGIGTSLTNDVGITPLSIVIKLVRVNGQAVAKISDEPEKAICEDQDFLNYLKKVYQV